ncbi:MAG: MarR family transcriptional regulator [Thermomicrobiaceae bacterium]|nr:MarR family transcriptional regulator [Thermomicrobiaceae bacterium]
MHHAAHPVRRGEITPQQYWLLRQLWKRGPLSIGELAGTLGISQSSATTACQRLEKAGLVTRRRQAEDERVVQVALTAEGAERFAAWRQRRRAAIAELLGALSAAEQEQLQRLVERILDAAEEAGYGLHR